MKMVHARRDFAPRASSARMRRRTCMDGCWLITQAVRGKLHENTLRPIEQCSRRGNETEHEHSPPRYLDGYICSYSHAPTRPCAVSQTLLPSNLCSACSCLCC